MFAREVHNNATSVEKRVQFSSFIYRQTLKLSKG